MMTLPKIISELSASIRRSAMVAAGSLLIAVSASAAVTDLPRTNLKGVENYYYDVESPESIYQIATSLGVTRDDIIRYNPSVADGVKPKMRLFFPVADFEPEIGNRKAIYAAAAGVTEHVVKNRSETVYGVANRYGMSVERLVALNPEAADGLRKGMVLKLVDDDEIAAVAGNDGKEDDRPTAVADMGDSYTHPAMTAAEQPGVKIIGDASDEDADTLSVAVLLPFMLSEPTQSRTTQLYTEFFKGVLLAASESNRSGETPVRISFLDTSANNDTVAALISAGALDGVDLVIAPDAPGQISAVAEAVGVEVPVVNIFAVKDELYLTRPNVVQTNIPHDEMYRKAIEAFMDRYEFFMPVFISRIGGSADKDEFTALLKERLTAEGRPYREVIFESALGDDQIADLDPMVQPLVFVPNSGSRSEFNRFSKALINKSNASVGADAVTIFGYPEWVTFRGDNLAELKQLGATIYSRFLSVENDYRTEELKNRYREAFGVEMFDAVPTQGILGYDMGRYVIDGLRRMGSSGQLPSEFTGVQSTLKLSRASAPDDMEAEGGMVNNALYIITYNNFGGTEWKN